jgi:hypothetical protein
MICRKANGELEAEISGKGMDFKTAKGDQLVSAELGLTICFPRLFWNHTGIERPGFNERV